MILDDKLLDEVTARAKTSERLRMNFNLHDSLDAKAQRLLNALEPGTALPVHRHPHTDETYVILRGRARRGQGRSLCAVGTGGHGAMTRAAERLFALVRATLRNRMDDASLFEGTDAAQWREIYDLSSVQGVLAQAWDGMQLLPEAMRPPRALRLQWAVNVERIEKVYRRQERAIARLAAFYREHAIPMMLLKGYGLSLFYPVPEHRPCGDIDIWLFGRQPEADKLVAREWGVPVDVHKEHHTTFDVDGIMVENHYDFVNKETHASNARLERLFKQYAAQPGESVAVAGVAVYLPSEQLNALFLLRHAAVHFAAINIGLRHVLDWCVFVAHCHDRIDWPALYAVARETRMVGFLNCLNALCVDCLGLEAPSLPDFERDAELEKRVLDEILSPAFSGEQPEGLLRVVRFKIRRWWANRWKHRLVFDEGLAGAFVHSAWAHLKRPRSIAH